MVFVELAGGGSAFRTVLLVNAVLGRPWHAVAPVEAPVPDAKIGPSVGGKGFQSSRRASLPDGLVGAESIF